MNILINRISHKYSGAEVYNIYLLNILKTNKNLEITFSSDNGKLNEQLNNLDIKAIPIFPVVREIGTKKQFLLALLLSPIYFLNYFQLFTKLGIIDLVILESMTEKIFLTVFLRVFSKKIIWIEHGPLFTTQRASIIKLLYKATSTFVNKIICVSKDTQNDLVSHGVNKKKTIVIYIGIDTMELKPLNAQETFRIKSKLNMVDSNVVGFLGTVSKEKGILDFLETATFLSKEMKNIKFVVIGNGDLLAWTKEEAKRRKLDDKFFFTGFISNIREYVGIIDVLLFPTHHYEGLSISLLEASALGIPVVATDIGGNREIIIDNTNGFLYKNSSPRQIRELIVKALAKKKELKSNARKVVLDRFTMDESGERFYQLFKEVASGR